MVWCRDPLLAQLNALGFNALRIPRTDYEPCRLLVRQGKVPPSLFGSLTDGFVGVRVPEATVGAAGQLAKAATAKYRRGIGLRMACDWLRATLSSLEAVFDEKSRVSFRFGDMRLLSVPLAALSQAFTDAEPAPALSDVPGARLFVIGEVLQAKEFVMIGEGGSTKGLAASPVAFDPAGPAVEVSIDSSLSHAGVLVFKANKFHTIGFKAFEIELSGGDFRLVPTAPSAGLTHLSEGQPSYEPIVFDEYQLF
ncbi:MAG: hypothetical protein SFV23_04575 [Planctomycetaceae bacterium]|nr:hypothetical protein [Planctomycetaceae bacterium]